jgi:hypothetical protein
VGPRAVMDAVVKRKIPSPPENTNSFYPVSFPFTALLHTSPFKISFNIILGLVRSLLP